MTITMSKPYGFRYRSGQYIFLQCPTISPFEWFVQLSINSPVLIELLTAYSIVIQVLIHCVCFRHPFSITSAPGDDYLSVHIRTNGDWTQELKRIFVENYFSPHLNRRASFSELGAAEPRRSAHHHFHDIFLIFLKDNKLKIVFGSIYHSLPRLLVDGPYGAPAQDFRNYDVLLLVGLGIGATPFISILRDLLNNIKLAEELMVLLHPMLLPFLPLTCFSFIAAHIVFAQLLGLGNGDQ